MTYIICKDKYYYANKIIVGLKTHYHFSEDICYAKQFLTEYQAKKECDFLNKQYDGKLKKVRVKFKVKEI